MLSFAFEQDSFIKLKLIVVSNTQGLLKSHRHRRHHYDMRQKHISTASPTMFFLVNFPMAVRFGLFFCLLSHFGEAQMRKLWLKSVPHYKKVKLVELMFLSKNVAYGKVLNEYEMDEG